MLKNIVLAAFFCFSCKSTKTSSSRTEPDYSGPVNPLLTKPKDVTQPIPPLKTLSALQSAKEKELRSLAQELLKMLEDFENDYPRCKDSKPILSAEDLAVFKTIGPDALEEALISLEGPPLIEEAKEENTDSSTSEKKSWYDDQTNWGVFNMMASIVAIGGVLSMDTSVKPSFRGDLELSYREFIDTQPKIELSKFRTEFEAYLNKNKPDLIPEFKKQFTKAEEVKLNFAKKTKLGFKAVGLGAGMGMLLSGAFMTMAGSGQLGLTESANCEANTTLRNKLFALKDKVRDLKTQLSVLEIQTNIQMEKKKSTTK